MKLIFSLLLILSIMACNDSKKQEHTTTNNENTTTNNNITPENKPAENKTASAMVTVDGKDIPLHGSLLVGKDKEKLQPGNDFLAMLTASEGSNKETLTLNFLFALKPGVYPVVGMSFLRGDGDKAEMYGGLLGGKEKMTDYKVTLTDVKDLGSNNLGGHKWSISGSFENITIPAMSLMMLDKSKNHPKEIVVQKGSFINLTFDDNWEEIMKNAFDKMKTTTNK